MWPPLSSCSCRNMWVLEEAEDEPPLAETETSNEKTQKPPSLSERGRHAEEAAAADM